MLTRTKSADAKWELIRTLIAGTHIISATLIGFSFPLMIMFGYIIIARHLVTLILFVQLHGEM